MTLFYLAKKPYLINNICIIFFIGYNGVKVEYTSGYSDEHHDK